MTKAPVNAAAEKTSASNAGGASSPSAAQRVIGEKLQALSPTHLAIKDESHLHIGHREAGSGGHFRLRIVAPQFAGKSRLQRHRLVFDTVGDLAKAGAHALSIQAYAPEEYFTQQPQETSNNENL